MYLTENIHLIRTILDQLPAEGEISSTELDGDQEQILFGLREMIRLNLISGSHHYSEHSDPTGPLLSSVSSIRLTTRGITFKGQ
ncbi:hypothetical protein SAMN05216202_2860 [Pseudomonas mucidolens]|uniref:Uncharacterized protein n=1 Tax=Pseudomonas mucidolens TaxID=46679 RepID=A0A1H2N396_9PSED|nr:hypothetical protein SAMN05216202_2860 [Pseudomonas mucidolens]SQH32760.1 Uncharacterised protein [Pseudomonas mucidolens]